MKIAIGFHSLSEQEFLGPTFLYCFPCFGLAVTPVRKLKKVEMFFLPSLLGYTEQYLEYDPFLLPPDPSNPWLSDDTTFWELEAR